MSKCNKCPTAPSVSPVTPRSRIFKRRSFTNMMFSRGLIVMVMASTIFNTGLFYYVVDHIVKTPGHLSETQEIALDRIYQFTESNPKLNPAKIPLRSEHIDRPVRKSIAPKVSEDRAALPKK